MFELLGYEQHIQSLPAYQDLSVDTIKAVIEEGAKFCENEIAPLNRVGDSEGCHWDDGVVTTPKGFKEAYKQFVDAGWHHFHTMRLMAVRACLNL